MPAPRRRPGLRQSLRARGPGPRRHLRGQAPALSPPAVAPTTPPARGGGPGRRGRAHPRRRGGRGGLTPSRGAGSRRPIPAARLRPSPSGPGVRLRATGPSIGAPERRADSPEDPRQRADRRDHGEEAPRPREAERRRRRERRRGKDAFPGTAARGGAGGEGRGWRRAGVVRSAECRLKSGGGRK
ncbi:uncharacterized protein LOC101658523 [Echinops telfairi]|uniref:Uncharacterized protein LOC101658523 n=1 Tax=Echinops telfairi TaxID=9371 RepID=A0ABM0IEN2_ECHTE|nr:uncharacterized protein LOC101658523 [Echinops telfairi]